MAIGMGNLLDAFVENGLTNHVKGGILHMSRPPQAVEVESEADLEALGELPAGSIAYTSEYAHMWQLTGSGTWAATEEKGGSGGGGNLVVHQTGGVDEPIVMDKTWQEIFDAVQDGQYVCLLEENGEQDIIQRAIVGAYADSGEYGVMYYMPNGQPKTYLSDSADGYPVYANGGN